MLDLKTRVKLEEEELVGLSLVEVLDGTRANVADLLGEALGRTLHLEEGVRLGDGGRALLEDLLEAALGRAVAAVDGHSVAVLVADDLDLKVARAGAELHHEHGRARDLGLDLREVRTKLLLIIVHADALTAATLGRLEHDREADALRSVHGLLNVGDHSLVEDVKRDGAILLEVRLKGSVVALVTPRTRPRDRRHVSGLRQNIGSDLVTEHTHHGSGRADELDTELGESGRQLRVLRGMAPAGPHRVDVVLLGNIDNDVDVSVVVRVFAGRDLHVGVSELDELGVGLEIFGGGHSHELDGVLVAQLEVGPLAHGEDGLGRGHAVVGDQDLTDRPVTAVLLDVLLERVGGAGAGGGRRRRSQRHLERIRRDTRAPFRRGGLGGGTRLHGLPEEALDVERARRVGEQ
mmetsp:Transcript_49137/g.139181  ORF Transcript_49137/g.139181 Transcript_49137/m.139181 type:complete len:406 (-) Transcript_49137:115-1332(-)